MFRRDPLVALLREVGQVLGREPEASWKPLARQVFTHGGVIGVSRAGAGRVFAVGDVPTGGVFELASVTKPFTAALANALVLRGALTWETPLRSLGGPLRALPRHLTPLSLSTHTAGLPTHPARANLTGLTHFHDPYGSLSAQAVFSSARRWARPAHPARFLYSNLGVGVLALALTHISGHPLSPDGYERALREQVLTPLDLPSVTLSPHPARLVTPRGLLGGNQPTAFGALTGAGGLYGDAADLLRFGQAHLIPTSVESVSMTDETRAEREEENTVLRRWNLRRVLSPEQMESEQNGMSGAAGRHWQHHLTPAGLLPPHSAVAPGWFYSDAPGGPILWHDGVARGTRSVLGFQPARGTVVVLLARGGLPVLGQRSGVPLLLLRLLGAGSNRG